MKRYDNLFDSVANFENVYMAYLSCKKGKSFKPEVMEISARAEMICSDLVRELQEGIYTPGKYYEFEARNEVKRRIIHAPLFRDRVVQHAIVGITEPLFERKFIFDSYANRKGKGNHRAVQRAQQFLRKSGQNVYILQGDFAKYYDNVRHEFIRNEIRRTIKDERLLNIWDRIIDSYNGDIDRGIPIGAPLSQLMANITLNPMDHFVKETLRAKYYIRLMDDFIIIDSSKERLKYYLQEIVWFTQTQLGQPLNRKTRIFPAKTGIDFGGYRIFTNKILPRKRNVKAAKRRFRTIMWLKRHGINARVEPRKASFLGYMKHCNGKRTTESTLKLLEE